MSHAKFIDSNIVESDGIKYNGKHILIAVGGFPYIPKISGKEFIETSDDFFNKLDYVPKKVAVVGAGYIAVELAQVLQGLGSEVHLFIRGEHPLRKFDIMIQKSIHNALCHSGVKVINNSNIIEIKEISNKNYTLITKENNNVEYKEFDYILYAIGRGPLTEDLGLQHTKVIQDKRGFIQSNEWEETNQPGIYALGDINNKVSLTPVAIRAGRKLGDRLFGNKKESKMNYSEIPSVVFSHPTIASIGYSEKEVKNLVENENEKILNGPIKVYESHFRNLMYGVFDNQHDKIRTHMKIICVGDNEKVVGLHMSGEGSDEMLQGFGVAIKMGATKKDFDSCCAIHPTASEELVTMKEARKDTDKPFIFEFEKEKENEKKNDE